MSMIYKTVICVDSHVEGYHNLINHALPETKIIVLNKVQNGITQITEAIANLASIQSLYLLTHGSPGCLQLGNLELNLGNLSRYTQQIRQWRQAFEPDGEILIYSCNVAAGNGLRFIQNLAQLTQTKIAASCRRVGNAALGGDWNLDVTIGEVKSPPPFEPKVLAAYPGVLVRLINEGFNNAELSQQPFTDELLWIYGTRQSVDNPDDPENPFLTARETRTPQEGGIPGVLEDFTPDPDGSGALQLTSAINDETGFIIYDFPVRADAGLDIEFDLHIYGGDGGDGISFFLIDGEASPQKSGSFGGSLGYAQFTRIDGLEGGYLGIGFDEFGNFANPTEGRVGGPGRTPDAVTVRGSEEEDYKFLTTSGTLDVSLDNTDTQDREEARRRVEILLTQEGLLTIFLDLDLNGSLEPDETVIEDFDVVAANGNTFPETFKFGFAASTGRRTNIHEISNLEVDTLQEPPVLDLDSSDEESVNFETTFTEGEAAVGISNQTVIVDADDDEMSRAVITLENPLNGEDESLGLTDETLTLIENLDLSLTENGSQIEIEGSASNENYATIIDGILYNNIADEIDTTPRQVTAIVRDNLGDGGFDSNEAITTIEIEEEIVENRPPITDDVENDSIRNDASLVTLSPLSGSDPDGEVISFRITNLPLNGTIFFDGNAITNTSTEIPVDQAEDLQFTPSRDFTGTTTFNYAAIDDDLAEDPSPATFSIPIVEGNLPPQTQDVVTNLVRNTAVQASILPLQGTDSDGTVEGFRITTLPERGTLFLDDETINIDQIIEAEQAGNLTFTPNTVEFFDSASFEYAAIDNEDLEDPTPAVYVIPTIGNFPPVADIVIIETIENTDSEVPIQPPPSGVDIDGTVENFSITELPLETEGQLFLNGEVITDIDNVQDLDIELADALSFTPAENFVGAASFEYTVEDNEGLRSLDRGSVTIPVIGEEDTNIPPVVFNINLDDPIRNDVEQFPIPMLDGDDPDGDIEFFSITRLSGNGQLFLDGEAVTNLDQVSELNETEASQLTFTPNSNFVGTSSYSYTATDDDGATSTDSALITISVIPANQPPTTNDLVSTSILNTTTLAEIPEFSGSDSDGIVVGFRVTSLPSEESGILIFNGEEITELDQLPQLITADESTNFRFTPDSSFVGNTDFEYAAVDNEELEDPTPATITLPITAPTNIPPQVQEVIFPRVIDRDETNVELDPLVGVDVDGEIESFTITRLPSTDAGQLFLNGVEITDLTQVENLSPTEATQLEFTPTQDLSVNLASFDYTATDDDGAEALLPANYIIVLEQIINQPPNTDNLRNPEIETNTQQATLLPLTGTDLDGEVVGFRITELPNEGQLFVEGEPFNDTTTILSPEQAENLQFTPNLDFEGFTDFRFAAVDDAGEEDPTPALFTIPVVPPEEIINQPPNTDNLRNPEIETNTQQAPLIPLSGTDPDGEVVGFRITELPAEGQLFVDGEPFNDTTKILSPEQAQNLQFSPNVGFDGFSDFSFAAIDDQGLEDLTPALFTIPVVPPDTPIIPDINQPPNTDNIINPEIERNTQQAPLLPLTGTDPDGEVVSFRITELPDEGQLFVNGEAVNRDETLSPEQAQNLQFTPNLDFEGFSEFRVAAIDNEGLEDPTPGLFIVPVVSTGTPIDPPDDPLARLCDNFPSLPSFEEIAISLPERPDFDNLERNITEATLTGSNDDDILVGSALPEDILSFGGNDFLDGVEGNDNLLAEAGNDTLDGGEGNDFLQAGSDDDDLLGWFGADTLDGEDGNDSLFGGTNDLANPDINGEDLLIAGLGDDFLQGNENRDSLSGDEGNDILYGGKGEDLAYGDAGGDTLFGNLDNDTLLADPGRDDFLGDGLEQDIIFGNQGNDLLHAGPGNDIIYGGKDDDFGYGGKDNDLLEGDLGNDSLFGDLGDDRLFGESGEDVLWGGVGNDTVNGGEGQDTLGGGEGDDEIRGGTEDDLLFGEAGDDEMFGDQGRDTLRGNAGNDTLFGDVGNTGSSDQLCGDEGDDILSGNLGEDILCGEAGNDTLYGGEDNDSLVGGEGNDWLFGDLGSNAFSGGSGQDRFILNAESRSNLITDFTQGEDLLGLTTGLTFSDLTFEQTDTATLVRVEDELFATLNGVDASQITADDFIEIGSTS
ncbi:MAG: DUF4347 domain-containing protein [Cyanobacteria bacterium J06592_8]